MAAEPSDNKSFLQKLKEKYNNNPLFHAAAILSLLIVIGLVGVLGWWVYNGQLNKTAFSVDGDQVSRAELSKFEQAYISANEKANTNDPKLGAERAREELTLNTLLKNDAKKLGKSVSREDVDKLLAGDFEEYGGKEGYFNYMRVTYGWDEEIVYLTRENELLKKLLARDLLKTYDLSAVFVRWDNLGYPSTRPDKEEYEQKAKAKLENELHPLLKSGASISDIEAKVDMSSKTPVPDMDRMLTDREGLYTHYKLYGGMTRDYEFQQYPEGEDNWKYIEQLKNKGDVSPVFRSSTGYYITYRLENISGGEFINWADYLKRAEDSRISSGPKFFKPNLGKATEPLRELLNKKASAEHGSFGGCFSSHLLRYDVFFRDWHTNAYVYGPGIRFRRAYDDNCSTTTTGNYYTTSDDGDSIQAFYDDILTTGQGNYIGSAGWEMHLNCNGAHWLWKFYAPDGFYHPDYDDNSHFILGLDGDGIAGEDDSYKDGNNTGRRTDSSWGADVFAPYEYSGANGDAFDLEIRLKRVNTVPVISYQLPADDTKYIYGSSAKPLGSELTINLNSTKSDANGDVTEAQFAIGSGTFSTGWSAYSTSDNRSIVLQSNSTDTSWRWKWAGGTYSSYISGPLINKTFRWNADVRDDHGGYGASAYTKNGSVYWYFQIIPAPDLISQNLSNPGTIQEGTAVTFTGDVKNNGGSSAGASTARFCMDNPSCTPNAQGAGTLGDRAVTTLGAGVTSTVLTSDSWTATAGSHTIYLCADVGVVVSESSETNNCASQTFTVNGVNKNFTVTPVLPSPVLKPDNELPTNADFTPSFTVDVAGQAAGTTGVKATISNYSVYIKNTSNVITTTLTAPPAFSPNNTNSGAAWPVGTKALVPATFNRTFTTPTTGYKVCISMTISPTGGTLDTSLPDGTGTVNSVGDAITKGNPKTVEQCSYVANKPYVKIFGGSVFAGSCFKDLDGNCNYSTGKIDTYTRYGTSGQSYGSSTQYAAQALGIIEGDSLSRGFFSASQRSATNSGYLTVSNSAATLPSSWGGGFGQGRRMVNFFDENHQVTRFDSSSPNFKTDYQADDVVVDLSSLADGNQYLAGDRLTITNTTAAAFSKRVTIFVGGDVRIANNISYPTSFSFAATDPNAYKNVPYLTIIAKGSIYIDKSVNKVTGLLIAQDIPGLAGSGEVVTCAEGFAKVADNLMFTQCNGGGTDPLNAACRTSTKGLPLEIYGAVVAKTIRLNRSNSSLKCYAPPYSGTYVLPEPSTSISPAEKIFHIPHLYFGKPLFKDDISPSLPADSSGIQSTSTLAPTF